MKSLLLMRADAGMDLGSGHVMRSLALAQAWQREGGQAMFASTEMPAQLAERLHSSELQLERMSCQPGSSEDLACTVSIASANRAACVVADGYRMGSNWQKGIKAAGLPLVIIDDYGHSGHYYADVVLNQNLGADPSLYHRRESGTRLLLGAEYALLRSEFIAFRRERRDVPPIAQRLLVTLGGSDPQNVSEKIVRALDAVADTKFEVRVVQGGSYPHRGSLEAAVAAVSYPCELVVDARDMPKLMTWADLAVSAAGSTAWELAFMGLPMVLIVAADNQREVARRLAECGAAVNLGPAEALSKAVIAGTIGHLLRNYELRRNLVENGSGICDGYGAERVVAAIRNLCR